MPRPLRAASILAAASRRFARSGYAATSMDEIAEEAGVNKLILYRHFNSKRELYEAVLAEVESRLDAIDHRPTTLDQEPAQVMREATATLLATVRVAREVPEAYRLLYQHAVHEPEFAGHASRLRARGVARAEALLVPLVEDRSLRRWAARLVATTTDEAILAWLDVGEPERDRYLADRLAHVLDAMLSPLARR